LNTGCFKVLGYCIEFSCFAVNEMCFVLLNTTPLPNAYKHLLES
jgi:hypothetical protein